MELRLPRQLGDRWRLALHVGDRGGEQCRILAQATDANVARIAKQPTNHSAAMVVVHAERHTAVLGRTADRAAPTLITQEELVLLEGQSVQLLSEATA